MEMAHVQRKCAHRGCRKTVSSGARVCPACGSRVFSWVARYRAPDGRERSRSFTRKVDAEDHLTEQEGSKRRGEWRDPRLARTQLGEYAARWLDMCALAPSTRRKYAADLRTHIEPRIGSIALGDLGSEDLRAFVRALEKSGLAAKSVRNVYTLLTGILWTAADDGYIPAAPLPKRRGKRGLLPPVPKIRHCRLTEEQVGDLADAIGEEYRALVYLGTYAAMRYGELAGLRVSDLRLLERPPRIEILEQFDSDEPKWGSSGTVTIPSSVADELARHLPLDPDQDAYVFTMPGGGPLNYANFLRRVWRPAAIAAGLGRSVVERIDGRRRVRWEGITPHDLRHTGVALAIKHGAHPRAIQDLARHTSFNTTMGVYGYLFPSLHEELASRFDEAIRVTKSRASRDHRGTASAIELRPESEQAL
jgi:integrase